MLRKPRQRLVIAPWILEDVRLTWGEVCLLAIIENLTHGRSDRVAYASDLWYSEYLSGQPPVESSKKAKLPRRVPRATPRHIRRMLKRLQDLKVIRLEQQGGSKKGERGCPEGGYRVIPPNSRLPFPLRDDTGDPGQEVPGQSEDPGQDVRGPADIMSGNPGQLVLSFLIERRLTENGEGGRKKRAPAPAARTPLKRREDEAPAEAPGPAPASPAPGAAVRPLPDLAELAARHSKMHTRHQDPEEALAQFGTGIRLRQCTVGEISAYLDECNLTGTDRYAHDFLKDAHNEAERRRRSRPQPEQIPPAAAEAPPSLRLPEVVGRIRCGEIGPELRRADGQVIATVIGADPARGIHLDVRRATTAREPLPKMWISSDSGLAEWGVMEQLAAEAQP